MLGTYKMNSPDLQLKYNIKSTQKIFIQYQSHINNLKKVRRYRNYRILHFSDILDWDVSNFEEPKPKIGFYIYKWLWKKNNT